MAQILKLASLSDVFLVRIDWSGSPRIASNHRGRTKGHIHSVLNGGPQATIDMFNKSKKQIVRSNPAGDIPAERSHSEVAELGGTYLQVSFSHHSKKSPELQPITAVIRFALTHISHLHN